MTLAHRTGEEHPGVPLKVNPTVPFERSIKVASIINSQVPP